MKLSEWLEKMNLSVSRFSQISRCASEPTLHRCIKEGSVRSKRTAKKISKATRGEVTMLELLEKSE